MRRRVAALGLVVALTGLGCSSSRHAVRQLQRQAAVDLGCAPRHVWVQPVGARGGNEFVAQGCGRRASYVEGPDGPQLVGAVQSLPSAAQPPAVTQGRRQPVPQGQQQASPQPQPLPLGEGAPPGDGELSPPPLPVP